MNSVQAMSTFIFVALFFSCSWLFGATLLSLLKVKTNVALSITTGLMLIFAENELVSLPFMLNKGQYRILLYIQITILILLTLFCLLYRIKKKRLFSFCINLEEFSNPLVLITIVLVLLQTIVPAAFARFDGDDAFYIAVSTSIQATGRVFANNPSIGLSRFAFPANYQFTAYEVLITIFSTLTNLDPVVVYHTVLPLCYIPVYYLCFTALSRELFKDKTSSNAFVFIIALLTLFDAYSNYLPSSFLLLKSWMGKGCTINFCTTLFLTYFIMVFKSQKESINYQSLRSPNTKYFFLITICLIAGVGTSAIGLYLIPVYYFLLVLTSLITLVYKKKNWFKIDFNFALKALLSVIPSALFLIFFYIFVRSNSEMTLLTSFESHRTWIEDAELLFQQNTTCLILYFFSVVYFLLFGDRLQKTLFVWTPVTLLLTFLNPLLHDVVGQYLTSMPLYWRFFWLFPFFISIACFIVSALREERFRKIKWRWIVIVPLLLVTIPLNFALVDNKYYATENSAKIPDDIKMATDTILDHVNTNNINKLYVLALPRYNIYLRQYTGKLALVMPRYNFVEEAYKMANERRNFRRIVKLFQFDNSRTIQHFRDRFNLEDLKILGITIIISPNTRKELNADYKRLEMENGDYLYIRNDIYRN